MDVHCPLACISCSGIPFTKAAVAAPNRNECDLNAMKGVSRLSILGSTTENW